MGKTMEERNFPLKSRKKTLRVGSRVYWNDPDTDGNSGYGTVVKLQYTPVDSDTVISLKMDDEGEVEAFRHELSLT